MKLRDLVNSKELLEYLATQRFPVVFTFGLKSFIREISNPLLDFEKIRNDKAIEYGEETEDKQFKVKQENMELFVKEMNELLDADVDVREFKISQKFLEKHNISLSVVELEVLDWLID